MATEFNYNDVVVVDEDEWRLECPYKTANLTAYLGGFECTGCMELKEGTHSGEVHLEVLIYGRKKDGESYQKLNKYEYPNTMRDLLTTASNVLVFNFSNSQAYRSLALGVRILKDRALFHDFTVDQPIGHLQNDLKLKVGEQIFHVNKQMLGLVSPYFHRMFNNPNFVEAKQDTVDTGETDAALFHDFLLTNIPIPGNKYKMLPNSQNMAGLLRLAEYYGVDSLSQHFERSLKFCREMPITERILMAKKYMGKEFNVAGILHGVNNPEELKRVCVALFKADE